MMIFEFIAKYCQDLVDATKLKTSLIDLGDYPHDDVVTDAEGKPVPVCYVDGNSIPIADFFTMEKADFCNAWKTPSAAEAYDNYIGALCILEGADVIYRIRNAIMSEAEELSKEVELVMSM